MIREIAELTLANPDAIPTGWGYTPKDEVITLAFHELALTGTVDSIPLLRSHLGGGHGRSATAAIRALEARADHHR